LRLTVVRYVFIEQRRQRVTIASQTHIPDVLTRQIYFQTTGKGFFSC
jgi:hypothetical protein